jgi:hypothetical protein
MHCIDKTVKKLFVKVYGNAYVELPAGKCSLYTSEIVPDINNQPSQTPRTSFQLSISEREGGDGHVARDRMDRLYITYMHSIHE